MSVGHGTGTMHTQRPGSMQHLSHDMSGPRFDLPRQQWCLLNHFRTKQGHCGACRCKYRLTDTDLCPCDETQMMSHIVESCPDADEDVVFWLTNYGS